MNMSKFKLSNQDLKDSLAWEFELRCEAAVKLADLKEKGRDDKTRGHCSRFNFYRHFPMMCQLG